MSINRRLRRTVFRDCGLSWMSEYLVFLKFERFEGHIAFDFCLFVRSFVHVFDRSFLIPFVTIYLVYKISQKVFELGCSRRIGTEE